MAKKSIKKTVEEVVKEVKDEGIPVKVVAEETKEVESDLKDKKIFIHESGQRGYMDEHNNFIPL